MGIRQRPNGRGVSLIADQQCDPLLRMRKRRTGKHRKEENKR
jgi:hypothetical protein